MEAAPVIVGIRQRIRVLLQHSSFIVATISDVTVQ